MMVQSHGGKKSIIEGASAPTSPCDRDGISHTTFSFSPSERIASAALPAVARFPFIKAFGSENRRTFPFDDVAKVPIVSGAYHNMAFVLEIYSKPRIP